MKATHCTTVSTHLSDKADVSEGSEEKGESWGAAQFNKIFQ